MAFTLATWNVLASAYLRTSYYPHTPPELFSRSWRVPALAQHAAALGADLLCLQEVETDVFEACLAKLGPLGYIGRHQLKQGNKPDGCATFVRTSCFEIVEERLLVYDDGSGHVAQILRLEHEAQSYSVLNTHLKWGPQFGYRQARQAAHAMLQEPSIRILCGDFNATPDSDIIQVFSEAGFDYAHRGMDGVHTCNSNSRAKLIDFIFYDGPVIACARKARIIDDNTPLPAPDQPSDHIPLLAEFTRKL